MSKKYLFIKYGPPASGKSKIDEYITSKYGIKPDQIYINDIDAIVENSELYKQRIKDADCVGYLNKFNSPDNIAENDETLKKCTDIYFSTRKELNAAGKSDNDTKEAIYDNKNIVYETTGCKVQNIQNWWLIDDLRANRLAGYTIVIFYPLVISQELSIRALRRAKTSGRYVHAKFIQECATEAISNLKYLLDLGLIDELYVYNNMKFADNNIDDMRILTYANNIESCDVYKMENIDSDKAFYDAFVKIFTSCQKVDISDVKYSLGGLYRSPFVRFILH